MQKIMFEHRRFGLEQAVIARLKENTRRPVRFPKGIDDADVESAVMGIDKKGRVYFTFSVATDQGTEAVDVYPKYQIGEKVAVAQGYRDIDYRGIVAFEDASDIQPGMVRPVPAQESAGWTNKMFVRAELMEETIHITNIKVERLQDITDEDCLKEGVEKWIGCYIVPGIMERGGKNNVCFDSPREAFAALIDRISGRGTWERNEWQFAYTFKLIKQNEQ